VSQHELQRSCPGHPHRSLLWQRFSEVFPPSNQSCFTFTYERAGNKSLTIKLASFQLETTRLSVYKTIKQLAVSLIEVSVRSFSRYMNVETARDMMPHSYCAPGTTDGLISGVLSKIKGRLLSDEDSTALEHMLQMFEENQECVARVWRLV
jgi:hypothetical protein